MSGDTFVFHPNEDVSRAARLSDFIARAGLQDLAALEREAAAKPEWFWDYLANYFGIRFSTPYEAILDLEDGPEWPHWFVGGTTNIVLTCLDAPIAEGRGDETVIISHAEDGTTHSLTYRELDLKSRQLANALASLGIGKGDPVAIYLPAVAEVAVVFFAVARLGALFVPFFSGLGVVAVAERLRDVGAKAIVTVDATRRRGKPIPMKAVIDEAVSTAPSVEAVIVVDQGIVSWSPGARDHDWSQLLDQSPPEFATTIVPAEHPLLIVYTSGTTGKPKGTVHTHAGFLLKVALDYGLVLDIKQGDRINWISDPGWLGATGRIVASTLFGACFILVDGAPDFPDEGRLWRLVEEDKVTVLGVSPTLVRSYIAGQTDPHRYGDLGSLRYFACTGEPCDRESWNWLFEVVGRRRLPILNLSGGTETGGSILGTSLLHSLKPCSIGGCIPGMAADILRDDGTSTAPDEKGELVMRQTSVGLTRGLYGDRQRYLDTYWRSYPGIWRHGDIASRDADGLWYVQGRSDDSLKIAGKRISAAEVEAHLLATGLVADAAAVGIPDPVKGTALVCVCVPISSVVEPGTALAARLIDAVARAAGSAFRPKQVLFVSDLPKTKSMKTMRSAVRSTLVGDTTGDSSALANPEALLELEAAIRSAS